MATSPIHLATSAIQSAVNMAASAIHSPVSAATTSPVKTASSRTKSHGQVIEYIQDRLYLASYTHPPNELTPFPYPSPAPKSPEKTSSRSRSRPVPVSTGPKKSPPVYFSIDEYLLYNRFHHDFGPLHIGHLYRFAVILQSLLGDPQNEDRGVVFWSKHDARSRANAACLLACYMILIQKWPPHLALAPLTQADPPFMPFRDAGYTQADYGLTVQDVVYGVWKAKEEGILDFQRFSLEEYETFERVDYGDFNWICPYFLAFASPKSEQIAAVPKSSSLYGTIPKTVAEVQVSNELNTAFKCVLSHFAQSSIGLVVRLNSQLYCPTYFTALGIDHLDMMFDDGTCPPVHLVKKFIKIAHQTINRRKAVAVHCKAGLGRTGCLIGAYLIYRHGFTANEVISFMRFMRPGMVVGPQQHWLHLHQGMFRKWWWEDLMNEKLAAILPSTPTKLTSSKSRNMTNGQIATPPNVSQKERAALSEIDTNEANATSMEDFLPAPTPGQPRKAHRLDSSLRVHDRTHAPNRDADRPEPPPKEIPEKRSRRESHTDSERMSEEDWLRIQLMERRNSSRSPVANEKRRAISYASSATLSAKYTTKVDHNQNGTTTTPGDTSDVENWHTHDSPPVQDRITKAKIMGSLKSGSGSGTIGIPKVRVAGSPVRRSATAESREHRATTGVRKTSGRVGSVGTTGVVARPSLAALRP